MHGTLDLPALRRAADLVLASFDEADRSVELVWSTGARVRRQPLFGEPFDEELSLDPAHVRLERLNGGAPLLKVHDMGTLDAVIGSVVPGTARIENGRGLARVRFSDRAEVEPILADIRAGHLRAVSIGYQVHRFEISRPASGPELWRAVDWTPFEISAVPVGADLAAGFRSAEPLSPCVVVRPGAPSPATRTSMDETQTKPATPDVATAPAPDVARATATPPTPDTDALVARAQAAERERVGTIHDLAGRLGLERGFAEDLVRRGTGLDEARRLILDKVADASDRTRIFPQVTVPLGGRDERLLRREAVSTALLHRYSPTLFPLTDQAREYRGLSLLELAREFLTQAGVAVRGLSRDEIATRALHSTSDFPEVLSAVTAKTLRQAYEVYPRTFTPFCRQVLATDFKAMHRVQIGEAPQLLKVNEGGEFQRGTIGESKESYRIETYGRVVAITRQVLINDDLDAFTRIPAMYGTAIATLESDVVWGILTANAAMADGKALFHADHKNLAGTAAPPTVTAIGDARAAMAKQTGLDRKTVLNIRPSFLIVPAALELTAEQLVAQNLTPAKTSDIVPASIRTLTPIAEPRLDAASATAWYLAANPAQIDTLEYAYLEGQQGAYIETRNGFDVDGVEIKCRLDFGAKAIDWRGLYKNAGA
ncbi:prohead protease/major capsid protein fusion protein [Rhodospirillum centenum]|uniref:U35 peptidase, phage protease prohead HK97 n=1 Tax=Rhodospirillum centenum (strain ATCC 51521 / SW) TaxID=414684 RepID=B6IPY2_RHOCS|nr:prohead protease/major capsid protein fusion protein [Rhodospirillum centenum]ACI97518.1 U35 peptidase, phage protease prohead HK97 [Rhodospirillum centenum SW]